MSDNLVPAPPSYSHSLQAWQEPAAPLPALAKSPIERPLSAIRRYKWVMLAIVIAATAGGAVATRFVPPEYEVAARIMIHTDGPMEARAGPVRAPGILTADDWASLFTTYRIADAVVRDMKLFVEPGNATDQELFREFEIGDRYVKGRYELVIDPARKRWTLTLLNAKLSSDSGAAGDSIGRPFGLKWKAPQWVFDLGGERKVPFAVKTPREAARTLVEQLVPSRRQNSDFLLLSLQGSNGELTAKVLNRWTEEFVSVATDLKRRKLTEFSRTLTEQVQKSKAALDSSEMELSSFRVNTITMHSEGTAVTAGVQETRDPAMREYFDRRIDYEDIKRDIQQLEQLIRIVAKDSVPKEALLQVRAVARNEPVTIALRNDIEAYSRTEIELATARSLYTDEMPLVKNLVAQLRELKTQRIPQRANELLASLRTREVDDSIRIANASTELKQIPARTIEEERLRRRRDLASGLFSALQNRNSEAMLAEASASPDVSVLDTAVAPLNPTSNTAPRLMLMAIAGGIAAAFAVALLLDRLDGRLRYPDQVSDDLGLNIIGTVPKFPKKGIDQSSPEQMFQLVESFRTLRLSVMSAFDGPITLAVSSPSPSEGKSLISGNLAMSFADAGLRTIVIDGDTRRGALNTMFGLSNSPGLTEYLLGLADLNSIARRTDHEMLDVISCGSRRKSSPELLASAKFGALVAELRSRYDVVLVDTPPLAAGIDAYAISTATGALLMVLRVGQTARRMTAEKLRMFERLPVTILGAALNGVPLNGAYTYYGYVSGYEPKQDELGASDESTSTVVAPT
jgi:capsular exopolysaccharide synthesis family protein